MTEGRQRRSAEGGVVVFGVGNESRGDDALAPMLLRRLEGVSPPGVRIVLDFQLQVEHALDLQGVGLALFVDAARGLEAPFSFRPVLPEPATPAFSHALAPAAVMDIFERLEGVAPPAFVLALRGRHFGLGEGLSTGAHTVLDAGWDFLQGLLARPVATHWHSLVQ